MTLIQQSITQVKPAYVMVNNRSEGNAPMTVQPLVSCWQLLGQPYYVGDDGSQGSVTSDDIESIVRGVEKQRG